MRILIGKEIQNAVICCNPTKIAVAYLGADWGKFVIDTKNLEEIIISPTIGTNPWAVVELAKTIGWDKIFFLKELHAKLYIGKKSVVIGSANLTQNGLSGEGLIELGTEIKSETVFKKVDQFFYDLKHKAIHQFPNTDSKKRELNKLEIAWNKALEKRLYALPKKRSSTFDDFELLSDDHFYICGYRSNIKLKYSDNVERLNSQSIISQFITFGKKDSVSENKWVLMWKKTNLGEPNKKARPFWLYIHEVYQNGVINEGYEYPTIAIQRRDRNVPPYPFELTKDISNVLKKTLQDKEVKMYLLQKEDPFDLSHSIKGIPLLIYKMKKELKTY